MPPKGVFFSFVFQLNDNNAIEAYTRNFTMIASTQTNHPLQGGQETSPTTDRVDLACSRLRASGLRITQPRIAILKVLMCHDGPVSIEQIHTELTTKSCDLVTVYRCLAAFEEIGLVRRAFFHNGTSLYQMSDHQQAVYHVVTKDTGEIQSLDPATSAALAKAIGTIEDSLRSQGYTEVNHIVEFFAKTFKASAASRTRSPKVAIPAVT
jgi:Fur family ferric uptake transcriptional regulator